MKEEVIDRLYNYLLSVSGGFAVLTPKQLEKVIGISSKQQSILRNNNSFPIKYKTVGRLVQYPINFVIDYLLNGEVKKQIEQEEPKEKIINKKSIKNNKNTYQRENLSHIFMVRSLVSRLEEQIEEISTLKQVMSKVVDIEENYQMVKNELHDKNCYVSSTKIIDKI